MTFFKHSQVKLQQRQLFCFLPVKTPTKRFLLKAKASCHTFEPIGERKGDDICPWLSTYGTIYVKTEKSQINTEMVLRFVVPFKLTLTSPLVP